jgi:hypothetical protein
MINLMTAKGKIKFLFKFVVLLTLIMNSFRI